MQVNIGDLKKGKLYRSPTPYNFQLWSLNDGTGIFSSIDGKFLKSNEPFMAISTPENVMADHDREVNGHFGLKILTMHSGFVGYIFGHQQRTKFLNII